MDGFVTALRNIGNGCMQHPDWSRRAREATNGPQGQPDIMGYHTDDEIPNYWTYAETFALHDRMFAPIDSWTLPSPSVPRVGVVGVLPDLDGPDELRVRAGVPRRMQFSTQVGQHRGRPRTDEPPPVRVGPTSRGCSTSTGVRWGYFVGEGTCTAPPCEKLQGIETAPVQNPLPGFTAVHATGQLDHIRPHEDF